MGDTIPSITQAESRPAISDPYNFNLTESMLQEATRFMVICHAATENECKNPRQRYV